ncbi:helix-turn-helix domain-containing protein [Ectobacillus polymachus]|uniref:helix-turn-helix domain-containing protein n=1 Tax=Ectobacillus polymachus TaxID=1508806 RepID=UPI003A84099F
MNEKAKLVLHPVRISILQTLVGDRKRTVQEIGEKLPDIPQATLYRHLNRLVQGGIIEVVSENQIRGTVEKVYAISREGMNLSAEEFEKSSKEDKMTTFIQFVGTLINDFGKYVNQERIDILRDGVMIRQADLYMSDKEFTEFIQSLQEIFKQALQYEPSQDRRKRTISTIIIPEVKMGGE